MNKSQLIESLSQETSFSKKDVTRLLESFVRIVQRTLKKGDKLQWAGFGTWWLAHRRARKGRNPLTGKSIDLPPISVPRFKPGKGLKEHVRG